MSGTATRDGLSLIAVVLGCDNGTSRFADTAALLDYGFANYKTEKLTLPKKATKTIDVKGGMTDKIRLSCEKPGSVVVSKSSSDKVVCKCKFQKDIEAPVKTGDKVGEVIYYCGKEKLKTCTIVSMDSVEKLTFNSVLSAIFNAITAL